jgi:ribose-phosphate pyrophosphokinase
VPDIMIFSGNANRPFAESIAKHLRIPSGKVKIDRFSDGEIHIEVLENVRGKDVFIVQPTCAPTHDNLMELILLADALRRASAFRITAVVPYFGYARQDRRVYSTRVPISAKVVADMIASVGIDRLLTVDLHSDQIQGFFNMPVDNVYGTPLLVEDILKQGLEDCVVVSPDVGGVVRARAYASRLNCGLAIIDKKRPLVNQSQVMHVIGDVADKNCIIVDDIIDTAGTICLAASALKEQGAKSVRAYVTHPVLSGEAVKRLAASSLNELVVCDSIPLSIPALSLKTIRQISIAPMLAEVILRVSQERSVSSMFVNA